MVYLMMSPVVKIIEEAGFFGQFVDLYTDFLSSMNLTDSLSELSIIIENVFKFILENISQMWLSFVGVCFVLIVLK